MSDEAQQYSIDNQKAAIQEYASRHGFTVVKTYADVGKSGVVAKHRTALRELLKDVAGGNADFRAVLVCDVSRWGVELDVPSTKLLLKNKVSSHLELLLTYRIEVSP